MDEREAIATVKYVSAMKPAFLLSEILHYIKGDAGIEDLYRCLGPHLDALDLRATKLPDDYRIERLPSAIRLDLTPDERTHLDRLLRQRRLDPTLETLVEEYIERKVGKVATDPLTLERLRQAITDQKDDYWREGSKRSIQYRHGYSVLAYLAYHLPVYVAGFKHILGALAEGGLLKTRMKVLDAGTGPGVVPLAIIDIFRHLDTASVRISAIEESPEHVEAYQYLVPRYAAGNPRIVVERPCMTDLKTIPAERLPVKIDLLVFSNVLNELVDLSIDERAALVARLAGRLADDGSIVIAEPADLQNATMLRRVVRSLLDGGFSLYMPCTFLWGGLCDPQDCWSFEEQESIEPTRLMTALGGSTESYRFVNTDVKYAFAILRKDSTTRQGLKLDPHAPYARLSSLRLHVGKRINVAAAVMSRDIGDAENHVYKLCDGTPGRPVFAVLPKYHRNPANASLKVCGYGGIVEIRGALVKYNPAHDAYNLLISKKTQVRPLDARCRPDCV